MQQLGAEQHPGARNARRHWSLLAVTPLVVLITHYIAVLPHEFAHSIVAWILNAKTDPLDIDWGGSSVLNVLLLINIDENVDYSALFDNGLGWKAAVIAAAGPGLANGGMYLLFRTVLLRRRFSNLATYALLWLVFMNLANLYDYIPLRTFTEGDISHFTEGAGLSPWIVYLVGGYLVLVAMIDFFRNVLPIGLTRSGIDAPAARASILVLASAIMFAYFAVPALLSDDTVTQFMGRTSVALIPIVIAVAWRRVVTTQG